MSQSESSESLAPFASERLLIERLPRHEGKRGLVISPGRAQLASHWLEQGWFSEISAWYLDLFSAARTAETVNDSIQVICAADLPDGPFDMIALPVFKHSDSELTCELIQQAHVRLNNRGCLAMSVDHATDRWVHEQMRKMFDKVSCDRSSDGCVYWAKKTAELKKIKNYEALFSYRDDDHWIQAISRPGVFAHRRIDTGARQLLRAAEIGPEDNVLDMGCGIGTLALAAAMKTSGIVVGVDSNARAIECLERNISLNELTNVHAILNADGHLALSTPMDIALANPPYFGDNRIAQHFVDVCLEQLRSGGALLVVTKNPRWYHGYFQERLEDIAIFESAKYYLCCGRKL